MSDESKPYEPPPNGFRTFVIIWASQSISVFGSALTFFAITIWMTQSLYPLPEQKPQLAWALSAMGLAFAGTTMIVATIAGAWADRHDRKRTMIASDFASGLVSTALVALMVSNLLNIWLVLVLAVLFAVFSAFHDSAFDTSYSMLVPEKQLPRANGMMQTIWSLSGIVSPGIAAFLISLPALARQGLIPGDVGVWLAGLSDGTVLAITIDAITFFVAALVPVFLFVPSPKRTDLVVAADGTQKKKSIWSDVRQGAMYIWRRRPMLWLLGSFTFINFVGSVTGTIQPLLIKFSLAPDWQARNMEFAGALAVLESVGALGGLVGGVLISVWGGLKKNRILGVIVPMIVVGLTTIVYGLSPYLFLTAAMGFIIVGMTPLMNAHSQAIWQTQTPRELQGRVFSVRRVIAQITWPLGTIVAGVVGGVFDPGMVMAVLGVALTVFCVAQLFNPYLRRVEDKEYLEKLAAERGDTGAQTAQPALDAEALRADAVAGTHLALEREAMAPPEQVVTPK
ncbi:MAG: MFS transporter [Chloroflexia bacterium]